MSKYVISTDGTWIEASACYLVEFPPTMDVCEELDTMTDVERGELARELGIPVNEL
jgi:hypothetical protein